MAKKKQPMSADLKTTLVTAGAAFLTSGVQVLASGNLDWKAYAALAVSCLMGAVTNRGVQ